MKVLWITNIPIMDGCGLVKRPQPKSGGWLTSLAKELIKDPTIELSIASVHKGPILIAKNIGRINYYMLPSKTLVKYNKSLEAIWKSIIDELRPDVVHIQGTEMPHGLAYLRACGSDKLVVSIQGLVSAYPFYNYGITWKDIAMNLTIRDIVFGGMLSGKRSFKRRAKSEREMLQTTKHVIGRTSWDRARVLAINPNLNYHFCNETLRSEFYNAKWEYSKCEPYTIFLSQAGYPLKGLHQVLRALPIVLNRFSNTKVRIAGEDITKHKSLREKFSYTGYGKFINSLINKLKVKDCIEFVGILSASQMKDEMLKANVFICPSSIENSPNSLGEAQIVGTPCISAYVGGAPDMVPTPSCGLLYRYEETDMLAADIIYLFDTASKFENSEMRRVARERHNREKNVEQLKNIYNNLF